MRVSGEVGVLVTGAFDLEEMRIAGERDGRVPHCGGVGTAGYTGEHGSEEVGTVDVDGGGADIRAATIHARMEGPAQRLVTGLGSGGLRELRGQAPPRPVTLR